MSAPDGDQLAVIRSWTGTHVGTAQGAPYDWGDLCARWERHGDPHAVALEILRQRRADFTNEPASLALDGDFTAGTAKNLEQLDAEIAALERICDTKATGIASDTLTVGQLSRPDRHR